MNYTLSDPIRFPYALGTNTDAQNPITIPVERSACAGFKRFELQLEHKSLDTHKDPMEMVKLVRLQDEYQLNFSGHAPYLKIDLASSNVLTRQESIEAVCKRMPFFKALEVNMITVHTGLNNGVSSLENLSHSLDHLVSKAATYGITIALETAGREGKFFTPSVEEYQDLCQKTGCKLTLDLIHLLFLFPDRFFKVLTHLLPYSINIHIGDCYESKHQHFPLGYGTFPFTEVFEMLKASNYRGQITVDAMDRHFSPDLYLQKALDFKAHFSEFLI